MVPGRQVVLVWLAHGADPSPLTWDEALATLALTVGTLGVLFVLGYRALRRWDFGREGVVWGGVALLVVGVVLFSFVASAVRQLRSPTPPQEFHAHVMNHGGQVAMWGDYHVEVARDMAGEYRVWLSDAYRRPISARFYKGRIEGVELQPSLDYTYAFARLPRDVIQVVVELDVPGYPMKFRFNFDERPGRRSLPEWCGPTPSTPP